MTLLRYIAKGVSEMTLLKTLKYITLISIFTLQISSQSHATVQGAQNFVKGISNNAIELIKNKGIDDKQKEAKLTSMFENAVDIKWVAKFVLGAYWNKATEEQRKEYIELHHKFLVNSYVPKFKEYTNQEIKIKKFTDDGNKEYTVETEITQIDKPSISVDYKVREQNGKYSIYDVIAEGVSLITTQRSDFSAILSREGVDGLIKKLREKVKA
ncbi:MAG: mlaC [Rickettsiaceae bacterium]|nr:mlaC [Rickettsiaceae bacterium]